MLFKMYAGGPVISDTQKPQTPGAGPHQPGNLNGSLTLKILLDLRLATC